ncbi:phage terminase small subunit [Arthrobacter sp. MDT3-44]
MPGPAPNPFARRKNARSGWTLLPADGRKGAAPEWPIGRPSAKQARLWASLWATPQAEAWEALGWTRVVARYADIVLACEKPEASAALMGEARQLEDRLGLSPMAMKRLQWVIDEASKGVASVTALHDYQKLYADL